MDDFGTPIPYKGRTMQVVKQEVSPFDVDGTLIIPYDKAKAHDDQLGRVISVYDEVEDKYVVVVAHEPNIRLLMEEYHSGAFVLVWSKGRYFWAEAVVKALGLTSKVHLIMSKPSVYFDDKQVSEWLPNRVFLEPDMPYKR